LTFLSFSLSASSPSGRHHLIWRLGLLQNRRWFQANGRSLRTARRPREKFPLPHPPPSLIPHDAGYWAPHWSTSPTSSAQYALLAAKTPLVPWQRRSNGRWMNWGAIVGRLARLDSHTSAGRWMTTWPAGAHGHLTAASPSAGRRAPKLRGDAWPYPE
jgi:hypothetical protein